jgi:hypothetical protein
MGITPLVGDKAAHLLLHLSAFSKNLCGMLLELLLSNAAVSIFAFSWRLHFKNQIYHIHICSIQGQYTRDCQELNDVTADVAIHDVTTLLVTML